MTVRESWTASRGSVSRRFSLWRALVAGVAAISAVVGMFACGGAWPFFGVTQPAKYRGDLDGLERVSDRHVREIYLRRGEDLGRYTKLLLEPLDFAEDLDTGDFEYRDRDFEIVRKNFQRDTAAAISNAYPFVDAPAADVLRARFTLTQLIANRAPLGVTRKRRGTAQETFSIGIGAAAAQIELRDSRSDRLLVAAFVRYRGWSLDNNTVALKTWGDVNRAFRIWGKIVVERSIRGEVRFRAPNLSPSSAPSPPADSLSP